MKVRKPIPSKDPISKSSYRALIREKLIWVHPERVSGDFLIYGTRVPLSLLLQFLRENKVQEFEVAYPSVSKDKIIGILTYLAKPLLQKSKAKVQ